MEETLVLERAVLDNIKPRLGEALVLNNIITQTRLERVLQLQTKNGGRLGDLLISEGAISYYDLYRTLAHCHGLKFIDLLKHPPSDDVPVAIYCADYLRLRLIPWRSDSDATTIAVCEITSDVLAWVRKHYGSKARFVITSPFDIRKTVENRFGASMENASCFSLWQKLPNSSARTTVSENQKKILCSSVIALLALTLFQPVIVALGFIILCHLAYTITLLFKCWVFAASAHPPKVTNWKERLATLNPQKLPVYTVLVPMYKEADSLPGMLASLHGMDYPPHKLDIKLILEADDTETIDAAMAMRPGHQFEIIRVPPGDIRTKPKACNYALRFARGEFVTVFDADDHPEPLQLKKAVYMFRNSPPDVVCLQARLNYYNAGHNLLTQFFSLEYTILFNFLLRGLEHLGIPIPLGGTSNHIALARLLEEGEWDPFNVTEDADLGTRFAARGLRTIMLDSFTMEEATCTFRAWIRQRSRWIKGYMQTYLVHMRHPIILKRTLGWKGFIGFQLFVGLSTFTFLSAPVVWAISILWVGQLTALHHIIFPTWLACLTLTNIAFNLLSQWCFTLNCLPLYRGRKGKMLAATLLYPLYMVLHSIASYKAIWQLIFNPHFWEKTTHGLAKPFAIKSLKNMFLPSNTPTINNI